MKKFQLYFLLPLLFAPFFIQAQVAERYFAPGDEKISLDYFTGAIGRLPLTSEYGLVYHRRINQRMEWNAKLAYNGTNFLLLLNSGGENNIREGIGINGVSVGGQWQYFLNPEGRRKWFVGSELNYTFARMHSKEDRSLRVDLSKFTTSAILGLRLAFPFGLELDAFVGLGAAFRNYFWQRYSSTNNDPNNSQPVNWSWFVTWDLALGSSVGWAVPIGLRLGKRF